MNHGEPIIVVHDLHKDFLLPQHRNTSLKQRFINIARRNTNTSQHVLDGINFHVNKGDFFGIVGRNGNGKSTLLKILAGVYSPTAGSVDIRGSLTPFIELGVGFNPELSGRDNVFLNGALLGFSRKEVTAMYDSIVEFAELEEFMDQKLKNYSSGMQVRLAFSVAIRARSDILLLDEVLAVGDAAFQQKCFNYFEELKREGQTVVFVSHDMGAVRRFCTKAIYVRGGKIIKEGSPSDIADLYAEDNINVQKDEHDEALQLSSVHAIHARISSQAKGEVRLQITYQAKDEEDMYIGLAVTRDGAVVGEISSSPEHPLRGSGTVTYTLHTDKFNAGAYQVAGVSLFRLSNRELLAVNKQQNEFVIKGNDITRGGALRLEDAWKYDAD